MISIKKVELQDNVLKHVAVDDFLPTIATVVDLVRQESNDPKVKEQLEEVVCELMFAHETFRFELRQQNQIESMSWNCNNN